ncbi:glycosyltransferase [Vibrio parahaemolyticus]|uniref:glycosyltransferase family 4 protein n=1 Tax=Vibrio parahaemolyticus TaxID=670 RepID=UPI0015C4FA2F|nr:glycosyltransferase family 4 protein [Vibrio parahaemolyticus]ELB2966997.1 glycosyltransferase [Vibrio parahaemolyticus]MBM5091745.1 glycosyltransferase [Vibrio parahaemolyticus]MBM5184795.1 glycosyltransferase [Vibrio parahaemolyticus]
MKIGTAFCDYDNYHAFSILDNMENISKYHYFDKPAWRKGVEWDRKRSNKIHFFSLKPWLDIYNSDYVIFWGVFSPFPLFFIYFIFSVLCRKKTIICSEGFKNKKNELIKRFLSNVVRRLDQSLIYILCIGNNSNKDYFSIGFESANYLKFGFFEKYEQSSNTIDINDKYNNINNRPLKILFVGQLVQRKGILDVIKNFDSLDRKVVVDIAGNGDLKQSIASLAEEIRSNVEIVMHGHCTHEELSVLYRSADVFLLPSFYEGWGVVVNQAIHYQLPIILSSKVRSGRAFLFENNGCIFNDFDEVNHFIENIDEHELLTMANKSYQLSKLWNVDFAASRLVEFLNTGTTFSDGPLSSYKV